MEYKVQITDEAGNVQHHIVNRSSFGEDKSLNDFILEALQKVKYALDYNGDGRKCLEGKINEKGDNELLFIWDKLHELIASGQIQDIINGKDEIENPLPLYTIEDGKVIASLTDKYEYPNTDNDGVLIYKNTHFPTREQAIQYGIESYKEDRLYALVRVEEKEKELLKAKAKLSEIEFYIQNLELHPYPIK